MNAVLKQPMFYVVISYIVLLLIISWLSVSKNKYKEVSVRNNQNYLAAIDTMRTERDSVKNVFESSIKSYNLTIEELENTNDSIFQKYLDEKGKAPQVITRTEIRYVHDTIWLESESDTVYLNAEGEGNVPFTYDNNGLTFDAYAHFRIQDSLILDSKLEVTGFMMSLGLETGIREAEDGSDEIFVRSNNPNVYIDTLYGNILPEKTSRGSRFGLGVAVGPTINYDIVDYNFSVGIGVTGGLVYKSR
jgi:hypothetical protein